MWSTSVPTQPHRAQNGCSIIQESLTFFHARFHEPGTSSQPAPCQPFRLSRLARPTGQSHHSAPLPDGSSRRQWGHRVGGVIGKGGSPNRGGAPARPPPFRGGGLHPATGSPVPEPPRGPTRRGRHRTTGGGSPTGIPTHAGKPPPAVRRTPPRPPPPRPNHHAVQTSRNPLDLSCQCRCI